MQRQNFQLPLMIGGATTSKAHTAVKIDPQYSNDAVVYVTDASRAVGVATSLLSKELKADYVARTRADYAVVRERTANRSARTERLSYEQAIANKPAFDWAGYQAPTPSFTGVRVLDEIDLAVLAEYIDWTPFFISWDLAGKYPRILTDEVVGEAATSLFNDAQAMLKKLIDEKLIKARAVFGFWPANQVEHDDLEVYGADGETLATLHHLRQQTIAGRQAEPVVGRFRRAEGKRRARLHRRLHHHRRDRRRGSGQGVRSQGRRLQQHHGQGARRPPRRSLRRVAARAGAQEYWGYARDEHLDNEALIKEQYVGIRPAPGYPACPDHTEKGTLFELLDPQGPVRRQPDRALRDVPGRGGQRLVFRPPAGAVLRGRQDRQGPGGTLQPAQGQEASVSERWLAPNLGYDD